MYMVSPMQDRWTDDDHYDLVALCREDDKLRAGQDALASPSMRRNGGYMRRNGGEANAPGDAAMPDAVLFRALARVVVEQQATAEFNPTQLDALAHIIAEVQREFEQDSEKLQQRILETVLRLIRPAEAAEQKVHTLSDRLALLENQIERRLSEVKTNAKAAAEHNTEVAKLRDEMNELTRVVHERVFPTVEQTSPWLFGPPVTAS